MIYYAAVAVSTIMGIYAAFILAPLLNGDATRGVVAAVCAAMSLGVLAGIKWESVLRAAARFALAAVLSAVAGGLLALAFPAIGDQFAEWVGPYVGAR